MELWIGIRAGDINLRKISMLMVSKAWEYLRTPRKRIYKVRRQDRLEQKTEEHPYQGDEQRKRSSQEVEKNSQQGSKKTRKG